MSGEDTGAILVHLQYLREVVDRVDRRVSEQNGRMRDAEKAIVVLQWAVGLIGTAALSFFTAYMWRVIR